MRIVDSLNFIPATNQQQHLQTNHLTADSSKKIPADVQLHNQGNLNEKNIVDPHNFVTAAEQLNMLNQITIANSQNFVPTVEKSSSTSSVSANVIKAPKTINLLVSFLSVRKWTAQKQEYLAQRQ